MSTESCKHDPEIGEIGIENDVVAHVSARQAA
jgi:hypothetical protein